MKKFLNITLLAIISSMSVSTSLASGNNETIMNSVKGTSINWRSLLGIPKPKDTQTVVNDAKNRLSLGSSLIRPVLNFQSFEQDKKEKQSTLSDNSVGNEIIIDNKAIIGNKSSGNNTDNNKFSQKKLNINIESNVIDLGKKNKILEPKIVQNRFHKKNTQKDHDIEISISTDLHDKKQTKPAELLGKKRDTEKSNKSKNNKMTQQQKDKKNQKKIRKIRN